MHTESECTVREYLKSQLSILTLILLISLPESGFYLKGYLLGLITCFVSEMM